MVKHWAESIYDWSIYLLPVYNQCLIIMNLRIISSDMPLHPGMFFLSCSHTRSECLGWSWTSLCSSSDKRHSFPWRYSFLTLLGQAPSPFLDAGCVCEDWFWRAELLGLSSRTSLTPWDACWTLVSVVPSSPYPILRLLLTGDDPFWEASSIYGWYEGGCNKSSLLRCWLLPVVFTKIGVFKSGGGLERAGGRFCSMDWSTYGRLQNYGSYS